MRSCTNDFSTCLLAAVLMQMEAQDQKGSNRLSGRSILVTVETGYETQMVAASAPQTTRERTLPTRSACTYWKVTNNLRLSIMNIIAGRFWY